MRESRAEVVPAVEGPPEPERPLQDAELAALATQSSEVAARLPRLNLKCAARAARDAAAPAAKALASSPPAEEACAAAMGPAEGPDRAPEGGAAVLGASQRGSLDEGEGQPAGACPAAAADLPATPLRVKVRQAGGARAAGDGGAGRGRGAEVALEQDTKERVRDGGGAAATQMLGLVNSLEEELFAAEARRYDAEVCLPLLAAAVMVLSALHVMRSRCALQCCTRSRMSLVLRCRHAMGALRWRRTPCPRRRQSCAAS